MTGSVFAEMKSSLLDAYFGLRRLARGDLSINQALQCARFYFTAYGQSRLIANLPRSGLHWLTLMMGLALKLQSGGDGQYTFDDQGRWNSGNFVSTPLDWRTPLGEMGMELDFSRPIIYQTYRRYEEVVCFQKSKMKTVILVRNPIRRLESWFVWQGNDIEDQDEFFESGAIESTIAFLNSWAEFRRKHEDRCLIVRFEDMVADLEGVLGSVSDFWELGVSEENLRETARLCSKEKMLAKIPETVHRTNPRVTVRPRDVISRKNILRINQKMRDQLIFDYGYDFSERGG